jgi:Skp family chaperone for outer membrane proteins
MKNTLFLILMLTLTLAFSHATQLYKWVDENGQTQFSQFPPSVTSHSKQVKIEAPQSKQSTASKEKLVNMRQKLSENIVDRGEKKEQEKEDAKKAERLKIACQAARTRSRMLQENGRIYKELGNGERKWYDVEERAGLIKGAKQDVSEFCSK